MEPLMLILALPLVFVAGLALAVGIAAIRAERRRGAAARRGPWWD